MTTPKDIRREEQLIALINVLYHFAWDDGLAEVEGEQIALAGTWITPQSCALIDAYDEFTESGTPDA